MDFLTANWTTLVQGMALFFAVGFVAQLVDGALGMAGGVICATTLLTFGVSPAQTSAMIHVAKCATAAASGASHIAYRNIDWKLFWRLTPAGILGGVLGAYILTGFDSPWVLAFVATYLAILGVWILLRAIRGMREAPPNVRHAGAIGLVGGFLDASGGGGWGPIVTSTLLGRGHTPRYVIGTVNTTEFLVAVAISAAFVWALLTGRFDFDGGLQGAGLATAGLIAGGLLAAPFAGYITRVVPARALMGAVGVLVISLAAWQAVQVWPKLVAATNGGAKLVALLNL